MKKVLKYTFYSVQDAVDFMKGKKSGLPPRRLNFVGSFDFENVGKEFFTHFKEKGGLQTSDTVLDIGCGIGRMALPLTKYLTEEGEYHGFDIDKRGIQWCKKNIAKRHPNFHFTHVDLYNKYYNKKGFLNSNEFKFPYPDQYFDFVFATSVFTHMLAEDVIHYFHEMARVLKSGGRALITFFSIDQTAQENIKNNISKCNFCHQNDQFSFYSHKDIKEAEIGYLEEWIIKQIENSGLGLEQIYHGAWSGRKDHLSYQDILILKK